MRLSNFIRENTQAIIAEWISFAETMTPASSTMSQLQLQDHIVEIIAFIADDIETSQTSSQQFEKSHGKNDSPEYKDSAAETHGSLRHTDGFNIVQMVSEYRALRASITKLWTKAKKILADEDLVDLTRFNETIDQSLAESVVRFMQKADYSKDLLLGILGHDIRSPLGAIAMSAQLMPRIGVLNEKQTMVASQIEGCSTRIANIVTDLLDLTSARIGAGLPIHKKQMDMRHVAQDITHEMRIQYPDRSIELDMTGDTAGEWDVTRIGQVFSNLMGNAVQYGLEESPIIVRVTGHKSEVTVSIQNKGEPIPPQQLATLFDSFTRGHGAGREPDSMSSNLGLGLFITKEIVLSHGGAIDVTSDKAAGTLFKISLPKHHDAKDAKRRNFSSIQRPGGAA
jgi:signal transduction histidine kinase